MTVNFFALYEYLCVNVFSILLLLHKRTARNVIVGVKNRKSLPFPVPSQNFLRIHFPKMSCETRRKLHFPDRQNWKGEYNPQAPSCLERLRRSNFCSSTHTFKISCYAPGESMLTDCQTHGCVQALSIWPLLPTDHLESHLGFVDLKRNRMHQSAGWTCNENLH